MKHGPGPPVADTALKKANQLIAHTVEAKIAASTFAGQTAKDIAGRQAVSTGH